MRVARVGVDFGGTLVRCVQRREAEPHRERDIAGIVGCAAGKCGCGSDHALPSGRSGHAVHGDLRATTAAYFNITVRDPGRASSSSNTPESEADPAHSYAQRASASHEHHRERRL